MKWQGRMIWSKDVKVGHVLVYGSHLMRVNDIIESPTMRTIIGDIVDDTTIRGAVMRVYYGNKVERIMECDE